MHIVHYGLCTSVALSFMVLGAMHGYNIFKCLLTYPVKLPNFDLIYITSFLCLFNEFIAKRGEKCTKDSLLPNGREKMLRTR